MKKLQHFLPTKFAGLLAGLMTLAITPAHASYTVIDDGLLPTSMVEARTEPVTEHYEIPFNKSSGLLTPSAKNILERLLPKMQGASIRIVGRPDAVIGKQGRIGAISRNRAMNIWDYLTQRGILSNKIELAVDTTPNEQTIGTSYSSDIYIVSTDTRTPARYQAQIQQMPTSYSEPEPVVQPQVQQFAQMPVYTTASAKIPATRTNPANNQLIEYINYAVQNGQMQPSVALTLLRILMEGDAAFRGQNPTPQRVAYLPSPAPVSAQTPMPTPTPSASPARKGKWLLDSKLTLHENIDSWLKISAWNPSIWEASGIYEITTTSTVQGDFPDVLRQIAESTGLNICVMPRGKTVRVTDSTAVCK